MADMLSAVIPFVSVVLGGLITYWTNVRHRRRTKVEDIFHEAIAAVAVAHASQQFVAELHPWKGLTAEAEAAFSLELRNEGNLNHARAVAAARAALARASAYDPTLRQYLDSLGDVYNRADEITAHLRARIAGR
jgi:hypothetical protein